MGFLILCCWQCTCLTIPKYRTEEIMEACSGVVYVVLHAVLSVSDAECPGGRRVPDVAGIFLCSWGCDTCAYVVGMLVWKT